MKKLFAILLVLMCAVAPIQAKQHLKFMGIELAGTPEAFKTKFLRQPGVSFVRVSSEGTYSFRGPYAGYDNCEFYLFCNDYGRVNNMDVYLPEASSWRQIKRQYRQMVNEFKADTRLTLYEEHSSFDSPYSEGDGDEMIAVANDKCNYDATFICTEGYIKVSISKWKQVYIIFYDFDDDNESSSSGSSSSSSGSSSSYSGSSSSYSGSSSSYSGSSSSSALTVMGLPITGSARQFANRLVNEKGCRLVDDDDPEWLALRGTFTGKDNCEIYLKSDGSRFYKVIIYLPEVSTWQAIRRQYFEYKAIYDNKYTVTSEMQEFRNGYREGDGLEVQGVKADECYFITQYSAPGGTITLYISKYMQLEMVYEVDGSSSGSGSSFNSSDI